jgi:hypothetical protein
MSHWQPVVIAERDIESVQTQVIVQTFSDRVLVLITQLSKVGTLVLTVFYCIRTIKNLISFADPSLRAANHCPFPSCRIQRWLSTTRASLD